MRRRKAVQGKTAWTNEKRASVLDVLTAQNMSTEDEEDDNSFAIRQKPNISAEFKKIKRSLDQRASEMESDRARKQRRPRKVGNDSATPLQIPAYPSQAWIIEPE
jgi:hypothetical protein